jgi:hypothetical protein
MKTTTITTTNSGRETNVEFKSVELQGLLDEGSQCRMIVGNCYITIDIIILQQQQALK